MRWRCPVFIADDGDITLHLLEEWSKEQYDVVWAESRSEYLEVEQAEWHGKKGVWVWVELEEV